MKLILMNRPQYREVPGLPGELDQLVERANLVWAKEHHPQTGAHTNVTATSVTTAALTVNETTQTTVGAAGGATALPATPTGYVPITINGTEYVFPVYAKA